MNKTGNFSKVQRMVILAVLIALTLVMALTPLGYLKIGALSISFLCIPIAIGATVLGPTAGLILGTLFGITSFVQCFWYGRIRHGNAFNQLVLHLYNLCCCTSSYGLVHRTYRKRSGQGI